MEEDQRLKLNLVEGTGINLAKDEQAQTLTINTTVNNVELTSPMASIDINSSVNSETNTKTFTLDVIGGGESGENTVLESPNETINITSAYNAQTNTRTFNIDVKGGSISPLFESKEVTLTADTYTWPNTAASFISTIDPGEKFVGSIILQLADFSGGSLTQIDLGYTCASYSHQYHYVRLSGEGTYVIPVTIRNSNTTSDTVGITVNGTVDHNTTFTMDLIGMVFG